MELRHLETLLAIAEEGSFTAAADALATVQSNVSDQVRQLERELGVPLLVRSRRGAVPTEFGLLVLEGAWKWVVLAIVWAGAACAVVLNIAWPSIPRWLSGVLAVAIGWVGVLVTPQLVTELGLGGLALVVAGGLAYTTGAVIFALGRPNPSPSTFGYHEVFHVLVIAAVACHYVAVAFFAVS